MKGGYKNILKGKSEEQIERDLEHLHPIDYFVTKFQYLFYQSNRNPSYKDVMQIINQINDYRLRFSIRSEMPDGIAYGMLRPVPTHFIDIIYENTFDRFERTISIRGGYMEVSGTNHISSGFGEIQAPPNF